MLQCASCLDCIYHFLNYISISVKKLLDGIESAHQSALRNLDSMCRVAILKMPKEVRNQTFDDVFPACVDLDGDKKAEGKAKDNTTKQVMDELANTVNKQVSD